MPDRRARCFVLFLTALLLPLALGCSGSDAEELYELARFEERQNNQAHARELYERIVREHPDSEYAERARARLAELPPGP